MENQLQTFIDRNNLNDARRDGKLSKTTRLFNPVSNKREELYKSGKIRPNFKLFLDNYLSETNNQEIKSKLANILDKKQSLESIPEEAEEQIKYLSAVDMELLDFLPEGFEEAIEANLPYKV